MANHGCSTTVLDSQENGTIISMKPTSETHTQQNGATATIQASHVTTKARDLTDCVLEFLSNASNETLGACIVALGATTWLVLGRVGLVLIGIVGGVVLHATWEGSSQGNADAEASAKEARKRKENGLDVVARVLDWREKTKDEEKLDRPDLELKRVLDFTGFRPETGAALVGLTDAVVQDYVK